MMNEQEQNKLHGLLNRVKDGSATETDYQQLISMINADESGTTVHEITFFLGDGNADFANHTEPHDHAYWQNVLHAIKNVPYENEPSVPVKHRSDRIKTYWFRYAAAAAIILLIAGAYFFTQNSGNKQTPTAEAVPAEIDIAPAGQKALLILADGSTIALDSTTNGQLAMQGNARITKEGGTIRYHINNASDTSAMMNTMKTPRGGQYRLLLPDGTRVWLNAESSITYPAAFVGARREVSVTGEVFFHVSKNRKKPFIVKTTNEEITVLGTQFNVNAYPDEKDIKTSLLEGSVKIADKILKPGEAHQTGQVFKTDIQQDLAWKNGVFDFNNMTVQQAMRQLSRWYDIEIVYDKPVDEVFIGEVGRNLTLSQVLKGLDGVGVHFRLEEKTLHVFP